MLRPLLLAVMLLPAAAVAQEAPSAQAESGQPPQRIRSVTLTQAEQKCPESTAEEVVVCSRIDANEQFRVPRELRNTQEVQAQNQSWVNRTATMDQISRTAGGLPNTCSPVGTGGFSGCNLALQRQHAAEKKAAERNDALVPGGGD